MTECSRKMLVLLVDDEVDVIKALGMLIRRFGYEVVDASNGQEALTLLESGCFRVDVVVTDLKMPIMDGIGLLKALREHEDLHIRALPVILCTASISDDPRIAENRENLEDILTKPLVVLSLKNSLLKIAQRILG